MFLLKFYIAINYLSYVTCYTCGHEPTTDHQLVHGVYLEPQHIMRKRSIDQRLRFHLVYDESVSSLALDQQELIKMDLIPQSLEYWQDTLHVRETVNNIKLQRQCMTHNVLYKDGDPHPYCYLGCASITKCGETEVPASHLDICRWADSDGLLLEEGESGEGVGGADFVLYVSAVGSDQCLVKQKVAYAASCQLEMAFDRPVAGFVNLCPEALSTHGHDLTQMRSTIKHEILHALGFSAGLYAFYRDEDGKPRTERLKSSGKPPYNQRLQLFQWGDTTIKTVIFPNWRVRGGVVEKKAYLMVTPKVKEEVRAHFNCSDLVGAELEDQDVIGTALSHWEKRLFENEAMTGTHTQNPSFSRLTLALLEDTGWYRPDYTKAEPLSWGAGLGCEFVNQSCMDWMIDRRQRGEDVHPFCDVVKQEGSERTECTRDRQAVALCNLERYTEEMPHRYRYFTSLEGVSDQDVTRYAGSVALADFCPYIQEYHWVLEGVGMRKSHCGPVVAGSDVIDQSHNYLLEWRGEGSVCVEHGHPWTLGQCDRTQKLQQWGSGCYKFSCSSEVGLVLHVHDREYVCPREHHLLYVSISSSHWLHTGTLICPSCQQLCSGHLNGSCPVVEQTVQTVQDSTVPCSSTQLNSSLYFFIYCLISLHYTTNSQ